MSEPGKAAVEGIGFWWMTDAASGFPVTPEMIERGVEALRGARESGGGDEATVRLVYEAMASHREEAFRCFAAETVQNMGNLIEDAKHLKHIMSEHLSRLP